jgi:hypothetical protein
MGMKTPTHKGAETMKKTPDQIMSDLFTLSQETPKTPRERGDWFVKVGSNWAEYANATGVGYQSAAKAFRSASKIFARLPDGELAATHSANCAAMYETR